MGPGAVCAGSSLDMGFDAHGRGARVRLGSGAAALLARRSVLNCARLAPRSRARGAQLQAKLAEARSRLAGPVDPATGRELYRPQTGRGPSFPRHGPGQAVGEYLYGLRLDRVRRFLMGRGRRGARCFWRAEPTRRRIHACVSVGACVCARARVCVCVCVCVCVRACVRACGRA
jgi:hypothetical protein